MFSLFGYTLKGFPDACVEKKVLHGILDTSSYTELTFASNGWDEGS